MKTLKKIIFLFLFLALYLGCSKDNSEEQTPVPVPEVVEAYEALNVSYGSDENQVFDIYLPENRTNNTKILILIHGGSWISGDKLDIIVLKHLFRLFTPMSGLLT